MSIQPIPKQSIHRLVAGQAVSDLTSAVKELVENAIDAGATRVCVKLYDQGLSTIQVTDNGKGVPKSCRNLLATKHATSKLRTFGDLYGDNTDGENNEETSTPISTLGFRGEALFSLANISTSLVVSTRTKDETAGEEISFDSQGNVLEDSRRPVARGIGTTVSVHGLFERLPVRRVDLCKRIKNQRMKLVKILQGYAILCLGTQFQLIDVYSSKSKLKSETVKLATSDSSRTPSLETRAASILGTKYLGGLSSIDIDLSASVSDADSGWNVQGLVSYSPASPHPSTARETHLFSINGRPVDLPNVSRLIGDVWKSFDSEGGRRPACILAFTLPNHAFDVNLSPDKRQVMFTDESAVLNLIREGLTEHWAGQSEGKFEANEVEVRSNLKPGCGAKKTNIKYDAEVFNKITPKSIRKKCDATSGESSTVQKPLFAADDQPVITPTVTQTQSDGSTNKDEEQSGKDGGSHHQVQRTKLSQKELEAWEQAKLNFNKSNKLQQSEELDQLIMPEEGKESTVSAEIRRNAEINQATAVCVSTRTCTMMAKSNEELAESQTGRCTNEVPGAKLNSDSTSLRLNKVTRSEIETSSRPKRKVSGDTLYDYAFESCKSNNKHPKDRDEECGSDDESRSKAIAIESFSRRKERAEELASKSGKMIVGKRIISAPQRMQGRARGKETKQLSSKFTPPFSRNDGHRDETIWNSFQGTQSVINQSRQSQVLMRKRRKLLHQSLNKHENQDTDGNRAVSLRQNDFLHMSIIGQFNLGFILARCRNNNLWMLDQHACDEKYNFELLCRETVIYEQKLLSPLQLELSPSEEHCVLENMDAFERNGFRFDYNPENEPRKRIFLTAIPYSGSGGDGTKAVQFGKEGEQKFKFWHHFTETEGILSCLLLDVSALCAILGADGSADGHVAGYGTGADGSGSHTSHAVRRYAGSALGSRDDSGVVGSSIIRLPKAIAMFASRACRRSIMIGTALSQKEQTGILKKLYNTEVPWNCAHGRVSTD
ncbi:hypothetical protein ACHAXN_004013 [Cyclotella atomus]